LVNSKETPLPTRQWRFSFKQHEGSNCMTQTKGKIVTMTKGAYVIESADGARFSCKARGALRYAKIMPLVGDEVTVTLHENGLASLDSIAKRKNAFIRPPMANLDCLFLVVSAVNPQIDYLWIDQMLSIATFSNVEVQMIITKTDLDADSSSKIASDYQKVGYRVWILDEQESEINRLREYLKENCRGKTLAFSGCSGVGKSTLMNRLFPQLHLEIGETSAKIERGKHTTKHVEMYPLNRLFDVEAHGGYLADTPGFSFLDFDNFDFFSLEDLPQTFCEFEDSIGTCRYTKCSHTKEEGCAIRERVASGDILQSRHQSYCHLYEILKNKKKWK
jgi:ribosome biogenesis GTPase